MLKEQDPMIELIREWIMTPVDESAGMQLTVREVFQFMQDMIAEHVAKPSGPSRLQKYLPKVRKLFLPLDLVRAMHEYDARTHLLARQFVPPTFREVRHILNLAVVNAIAGQLKLVTFDADDTIYEDGGTISAQSGMVAVIVGLLRRGVVVSLVTAAGYPGNPARYEQRLRGILDGLETCTKEERARFLVMGGECNYLLETYTKKVPQEATTTTTTTTSTSTSAIDDPASTPRKVFLREIDGDLWKDGRGERWREEEITDLLDRAEHTLREATEKLHMPATILRKPRAIGIINTTGKRFTYENLEDLCLTVQHALRASGSVVPFCAFNGGNDVWVDVGNKALGIQALQKYVFRFLPKELQGDELTNIQGMECLHVGDRFTPTGNDTRSRDAATTVWISEPSETIHIMKKLLKAMDHARGYSPDDEDPFSSNGDALAARHGARSSSVWEAQVDAAILAATNDKLQKDDAPSDV